MAEQDNGLANRVIFCPNRPAGCPIEGMESVVATVSGYHGTERFNLIKMISYTGASYVGVMSRSITHLICWELEGRKFNLAKKFKTIIVNHRWLEDCIKQGMRVPEDPYILQSGQSAGPLSMKLPFSDKGSVSTKKYKVPSEKLHNCGNVEDQRIKGMCSFGDSILPHSSLLDKEMYPDFRNSDDTAHKQKHKLRKRISKLEEPSSSSSKNHFKEPTPSDFFAIGCGSSSSLARDETKGKRYNENSTVRSSRRWRRLVKKNSSEDHNDPDVWNFDPEQYHLATRNSLTVLSSHCDDETDTEVVNVGGTADRDQLCDERGLASDSFEGVEACENQSTSRHTNLLVENAPRILTVTSEDELHKDLQKIIEDPVIELNESIPSTTTELSCVICWTDFSSTRGVLPCGHRFCYSCIQNWADHMASSRKISTCPLCKASFLSITKVEDAATSDQKIYSQTIPCGPSLLDIYILPDERTLDSVVQPSVAAVCSICRCQEPEDLLMSCHLCQIRHIHSYCLDPPLLPWICIHCKDLQTLYHRRH
ncbi:E3 ubiquitin-protein ligase rnf8-A isoform X1 [Cucurbita maxima]|uniref:E3 ubiquitin-protein ligase rnf8-A isoform X1 n=2 Tax=Cucurbita maxima TaxID=3661 RepID=A0A6J1J2R6_CUCMA|nr:E3 ubiquitin-protein ligase rnf8-A isoform X1 [Cucurbita maxima]XP_022983592.1 E3 ubiquitin-protein ligase rnf8-A isoform X1 [Cucurbita maxima]